MNTNTRIQFSILLGAALCALTLAFATPALAGPDRWSSKDKNVEVTPEEPFSWTGFYLGGNVGAHWTDYDYDRYFTDVDVDEQLGGPGLPFTSFVSFDNPGIDPGSDKSLTGGGQAGYQYQWGHIVVGVEGDFNGVSDERTTRFQPATIFSTSNFGFDTETNLLTQHLASTNWNASARVRLGYANGRALLYVTGGGAWTDIRVQATDVASTDYFDQNTGAFVFNVTNHSIQTKEEVQGGWVAGGGAEWAFCDFATVGLEYRHMDFGGDNYHFNPKRGPIFPGDVHVDTESDQVTIRINILLGRLGR